MNSNFENILSLKRDQFRVEIRKQKIEEAFKDRRQLFKQNIYEANIKEIANSQQTEIMVSQLEEKLSRNDPNDFNNIGTLLMSLLNYEGKSLSEIVDPQYQKKIIDLLIEQFLFQIDPTYVTELIAIILSNLAYTPENYIISQLVVNREQFISKLNQEQDSKLASLILSILADILKQSKGISKIVLESNTIQHCLKIIIDKKTNVSIIFLDSFFYLILQISLEKEVNEYEEMVLVYPVLLQLYKSYSEVQSSFLLFIAILKLAQSIHECNLLLINYQDLNMIFTPFTQKSTEYSTLQAVIQIVIQTLIKMEVAKYLLVLQQELPRDFFNLLLENPKLLDRLVEVSTCVDSTSDNLKNTCLTLFLNWSYNQEMIKWMQNQEIVSRIIYGFQSSENIDVNKIKIVINLQTQSTTIQFITNIICSLDQKELVQLLENVDFTNILVQAVKKTCQVQQSPLAFINLISTIINVQEVISRTFIQNLIQGGFFYEVEDLALKFPSLSAQCELILSTRSID